MMVETSLGIFETQQSQQSPILYEDLWRVIDGRMATTRNTEGVRAEY